MPHKLLRFVCLAMMAVGCACSSREEPELSPETYREVVTAFYVGLSAMQTTQEVLAKERFDRAAALAPQEPAIWADIGLLLLRQQDLDGAAQQLARAASLAPDSAAIQRLQALTESHRGNLADAISHWKRAIELDPDDRRAEYALALETERLGGPTNDADAQAVLERLLGRGDNLAARIEYVRIAAKRGDADALARGIAPLRTISTSWSPAAQDQLAQLVEASNGDPRTAATRVAFLKNVLLREPAYRAAFAEVTTPSSEVGIPLDRFLRLPNPDPTPAAADGALAFAVQPAAGAGPSSSWAGTVVLEDGGSPVVVTAGSSGVRVAGTAATIACRAFRGAASEAVAVADLNYDFRQDVALAGPAGLCLLRSEPDGRLVDVTAAARLPSGLATTPARGIWPADVDTDGDLDLVVALRDAAPIVLRNNSDGTFARQVLPLPPLRARGFAWADFDGEGVPDAAFVDDTGAVQVLINLRGGAFRSERIQTGAPVAAIAAAEHRGEAGFDLLALAQDGTIARVSWNRTNRAWTTAPAGRVALALPAPGDARLLVADLDNNGAADVVASATDTTQILLGEPGGTLAAAAAAVPLAVNDIADLDGDGRLEMIGVAQGAPVIARSSGSRSYKWTALRPRAVTATGDQRINSFGIGGEIELRSGLHLQRQLIASPVVHFGLGEFDGAEVARITWPNGVLQAEFDDLQAGRTIGASQRLKGSCPWLFTWNGREMTFVTDLIWRSPLGLRINAVETADTIMTEDWVKIRHDQLAARDGAYDLRITAELWETHFFDLTGLLAVDHPAGTEVFVDERFAVPPPALSIVATGPVQPFAGVRDDGGNDVSAVAAAVDSRYVDFAGRGEYQGITRQHFTEMELPESAPRDGPLWLVASGWIHPTDSSVNVAIAQGAHAGPESLSLQVSDRSGRFRTVKRDLGFPAGKDKTILIDLSGVFSGSGPRRLRLATNLEIYWDRLAWAVGRPDAAVKTQRLELQSAELSARGYSIVEQPSPSMPERPLYRIEGTGQRWRDLEGYYTRFGDVKPLVTAIDDRYVIMNAGDELRLRFPEAAPPAAGLVRDFVFMADGWVKDGDYNTGFSRTVLPLPTHADGRYATAPHQLEDDPVYRRHRDDFVEYHTRYVSPDRLRGALQQTIR